MHARSFPSTRQRRPVHSTSWPAIGHRPGRHIRPGERKREPDPLAREWFSLLVGQAIDEIARAGLSIEPAPARRRARAQRRQGEVQDHERMTTIMRTAAIFVGKTGKDAGEGRRARPRRGSGMRIQARPSPAASPRQKRPVATAARERDQEHQSPLALAPAKLSQSGDERAGDPRPGGCRSSARSTPTGDVAALAQLRPIRLSFKASETDQRPV